MRAATLLILTLLIGCRSDRTDVEQGEEGRLVLGRTEERESTRRGVIAGGRALIIEGFHGDIELRAGDGLFAELEFERIGRGDDSQGARGILEDIDIAEQGSDSEYRYTLSSEDESRSAVNIRGTIPRQTDLRLSMASGAITLSGLAGPLRVRNANGVISADGLHGPADLETQNGEITVQVDDLPSESRLRLRTSNGNVSLSLPAAASARVEAATSTGTIRVEGLEFDSRRLEPAGGGAEFSGTLGRGGARVTIVTDNGSVLLTSGALEQETTPAPPDTSAAFDTSAAPAATNDTARAQLQP